MLILLGSAWWPTDSRSAYGAPSYERSVQPGLRRGQRHQGGAHFLRCNLRLKWYERSNSWPLQHAASATAAPKRLTAHALHHRIDRGFRDPANYRLRMILASEQLSATTVGAT
jgi:hypothetical protein